jgi:hypothetical protein
MCAKKLVWLLPLAVLSACGKGQSNYNSGSSADSAAVQSTSAAPPETKRFADTLTSHKIIRMADMQCRVNNVFSATTHLENLVHAVGGIVEESRMTNEITDTKTIYYKPDSLQRIQTSKPLASVTLRVPSRYLDSVVNAIPAMSTFIDSRNLKQQDVTYDYLKNELRGTLNTDDNTIAQAHKLAKKSKEAIDVQQYENSRQQEKIDDKINNMRMLDNVAYATITITFSQPEQVLILPIANIAYYNELPTAIKLKIALTSGWEVMSSIAVFLVTIWPLLLFVSAGWIGYKKLSARKPLISK